MRPTVDGGRWARANGDPGDCSKWQALTGFVDMGQPSISLVRAEKYAGPAGQSSISALTEVCCPQRAVPR